MLKIVKVLDKYNFICIFALFNHEPTVRPQERGGGGDRLRGKKAVKPQAKCFLIGVTPLATRPQEECKILQKH